MYKRISNKNNFKMDKTNVFNNFKNISFMKKKTYYYYYCFLPICNAQWTRPCLRFTLMGLLRSKPHRGGNELL